jgi:hypothetical protein
MPSINLVITVGQSLYPHGFPHQDDFECRRSGCRRSLGFAGDGTVGADIEL